MRKHMTTGKISLHFRVQEYIFRKLANGGEIPHELAGSVRLFAIDDLPRIEAILIEKGYLKASPTTPTACPTPELARAAG